MNRMRHTLSSSALNGENSNSSDVASGTFVSKSSRSAKRKGDALSGVSKKSKGESSFSKLAVFGYPVEHPFNKDGYRYFLAEPDPHAPFKQEFDESHDTAGKPIPSFMYRVVRPLIVQFSFHDRAPQIKLSDDRLTVTGEKGYSIVRASHGVSRGTWFCEMKVVDQPEGSHARIGWSQSLACLQAPVGYDRFSYAWRSRKGTRFHESIGRHYQNGYGQGDVLGILIDLPSSGAPSNHFPSNCKDLPLIKFKSFCYFEEKDEVAQAKKALTVLKDSKIMFYKNGLSQGVAFSDIYGGTYYPAVSLYKNITVSANFGPNFSFPPKDIAFKPMSDRVEQLIVEQCLSDIVFFVENEGKLSLNS